MNLEQFFEWLENLPFATAIREHESLFPWFESVHVLAITLVVGTIMVVDLRLLGFGSAKRPVSKLMQEMLPFTRAAFGLAAFTGLMLFASHAVKYSGNFPFQLKMVLLLFALINIIVFHSITARDIGRWDATATTPMPVKLAGGVSLVSWVAIVAAGRWIGFT